MELTYDTLDGVCEFKLADAFNYWMSNQNISANAVGEKFDIHPKYLWQEYARYKAKNNV